MKAVLVILSLVALVYCGDYVPYQILHSEVGTAGNNVIYYTSSDSYFNLPNVENPLDIEIIYLTGTTDSTSSVCLNSYQSAYPIPGNNIANACPTGGFASLTNTTTGSPPQSAKFKFTRMNSSLRGQFLSKMVQDDTTNPNALPVYGAPTTGAGLAVTIDSDTSIEFQVVIYGGYCLEDDEVPVNGTCISTNSIETDGTGASFTVGAGTWAYYYFTTQPFDATLNNQVTVTSNVSNVYIQRNYVPSTTWAINTEPETTQVINTPGTTVQGETYFIGVYNPAATEVAVLLNVTLSGCDNGAVGPGCLVNQTVTNSTDGSTVTQLSATLTSLTGGSDNDGTAWTLDLSDSDNTYAYFQLVELPSFTDQPNDGFPYYVRVSVGNTELEDDEDNFGPEIYAKLGGYPSAESNDYAVGGSVANQLFLPVQTPDDQWYIAVQLPSDFSIWVGVNCAGNCSDNEHGSCLCSNGTDGTTVSCISIANSTNDFYPLYSSLPYSTQESAGQCTCTDDDYADSFDCSQKSSPTVLFIVLIVIGGLIILFVAIGVPLYCYISNKRKERYERI